MKKGVFASLGLGLAVAYLLAVGFVVLRLPWGAVTVFSMAVGVLVFIFTLLALTILRCLEDIIEKLDDK